MCIKQQKMKCLLVHCVRMRVMFSGAPCIKKGVQVRVLKQKLSYEYPGVKTNGGSDLLKRVSRPYFLK